MPHGAAFDVLQDVAKVFEDEVVGLLPPAVCNLVEKIRWLEEVSQPSDGFFLDGGEHFLSVGAGFIDLVELDPVVFEDLIGEEVHSLGEVFVEDEAQDVVTELVGAHFPPQSIRDVPKAGFEVLIVVFRHGKG